MQIFLDSQVGTDLLSLFMIVLIRIRRTGTDNTHLKRLAKCILLAFPLLKDLLHIIKNLYSLVERCQFL